LRVCSSEYAAFNTDNAHIDKHSGTVPVILARHWLWLRDDDSCV